MTKQILSIAIIVALACPASPQVVAHHCESTSSIAVAQSKACAVSSSNTPSCTYNSNVTSGNLMVACVDSAFNYGTVNGHFTNTDGAGTLVYGSNTIDYTDGKIRCDYKVATSTGSKTWTLADLGFAVSVEIVITEVSGLANNTLDKTVSATGTGTTADSTNTATTTAANEIVLGIVGSINTATWSCGTGFTLGARGSESGTGHSAALCYKVLSATGTPNFTATVGASMNWGAGAFTFK